MPVQPPADEITSAGRTVMDKGILDSGLGPEIGARAVRREELHVNRTPTAPLINWLQYTKKASFHRRARRLSRTAVSAAFAHIRTSASEPSRNLFYHVQQDLETYSGLRSALFTPACQHSSLHQQTRRVNAYTSGSRYAMRSKTLEADDLRSVLSPSRSSRYVPSTLRTREASTHYSATPSTGRIPSRSDRVNHRQLIEWAVDVIETTASPSAFIRNFARPIDLHAMPPDLLPSAVAIDVPALTEVLFDEDSTVRLLRRQDHQWSPLNRDDVHALLGVLGNTFEIRRVRGEWRLLDPQDGHRVGEIRIGTTRIALRLSDLLETKNTTVEPIGAPEAPREFLHRYLDRNNLFVVLFNQLDVVYVEGSLYRDRALVEGGERLLGYLHAETRLTTTVSEKGTFSQAHVEFDDDSVSGTLVDALSPRSETLACDDLGAEWADFIGVDAAAQPKTVTFYHAKRGAPSLSASAFHTSVSQAIKNLQHIRLSEDALETKREKWQAAYAIDGQQNADSAYG
jgi:hypothetical protein